MKKYYVLPMFTYPSGFGLHVGHASNFSITDYVARKKKMEGYDVIYPTGFDSFGLPTENFAIKQGKSADEVTQAACKNFIEQMKDCDFDFDWNRLFLTSDPEYYKWTQRIFKKLFDHDLAYKKDGFVNRCNGCQTVLANDQVVDGKCERCETVIIQKKHPQWYLKITDYADQLIDDLDELDWPEETKVAQRNWIARSYGAEIDFVVPRPLPPLLTVPSSAPLGEGTAKYLIFDFDGVLGDTFESNTNACMVLENIDREESRRRRLEYANNKPNHTKDHILSDDEFATLREWLDKFAHLMSSESFKLFDQFIEAVGKIEHTQIAIVSSGMRSYIEPTLDAMPFKPTHVLTFEDHHSKEEKIAHICNDRGISEKEVYYFTDTLADVYELEDYLDRTKLIGCPWGYCGKEQLLKALPPEQILNEFEDVLKLFEIAKSGRLKAEGQKAKELPEINSEFGILNSELKITVFTTRPDTIYGVTAVVLAPENQIIDHILDNQKQQELAKFRAETALLTNIDRQSTERSKNGMDSGIFVRHPMTDELIPVRYADYVLMDYATGAVMFVPAHDERDYKFRFDNGELKYDYPIKNVIKPLSIKDVEGKYFPVYAHHIPEGRNVREVQEEFLGTAYDLIVKGEYGYSGNGTLVNSPALKVPHSEVSSQVPHPQPPLLRAPATPPLGEGTAVETLGDQKTLWQYFGTGTDIVQLAKELRQKQTKAEEYFWELVRDRGLFGIKFRRQHPFGRYIADFFSNEIALVIELDGPIHEKTKEYDRERDQTIKSYNVQILRFTNDEVFNDIEKVLKTIYDFINANYPVLLPSPSEWSEAEGTARRGGRGGGTGESVGSEALGQTVSFNGLDNITAKAKITEYLEQQGKGRKKTTFRLRDWSVSRQRYWGSPIPVYYTFQENEKVPYFDKFDPQWTTKPDLEMHVRHLVYVLLKDKNSDRYCMLRWPDDLGISCISGGVDEGEDKVAAAGREAIEESGYQDIAFVRQIGGEFHSSYYHPTKDKNFYSVCHVYLYEADASQKQELDPKEASKHMPVRMTADEIRQHQGLEPTVLYLLDMLEGKQVNLATTDRYNAYNPHPDKSKWIPHAIPEEDLPVVLPLDLPNYKPAGKSPLEDHPTFKYYKPGSNYELSNKVPLIEYTEGNKVFREGLPIKPRQVAQCVVKDKNSDYYACLQWSHDNDVTAFFGGIEEGESGIDACARELKEEGGFDNPIFKKDLGEYHCKFYHPTKHHNQYSTNHTYYFEVNKNDVAPTSQEEQALHKVVWMTADEFLASSKNITSIYAMQKLLGLPITVPFTMVDRLNEYNSESNGKVPFFKYSDSIRAYREDEGKPFLRNNVQAVIRNPKDDTYCMLKRKVDGTYSFVLGGIEQGESNIEAAIREIQEETGYINVKFNKILSNEYHKLFYHPLKKRNQYNIESLLLFDLVDKQKVNIDQNENDKHEVVRMSLEEFEAVEAVEENLYYASLLGGKVYEPKMIDCDNEYNVTPNSELLTQNSVYLRECDTLDTFMCSSFYFLRFLDPKNSDYLLSSESAHYMPVDLYVGGKEHSVGHLIYARFIYKFLKDIGVVNNPSKEPFKKLVHQGMIHGADGRKMSKRWGNIIDPVDVIKEYNSDTLRTYLAFMGPVDMQKNWNPEAVNGIHRFLKRFEKLSTDYASSLSIEDYLREVSGNEIKKQIYAEMLSLLHQTIKGVGEDIDNLKFNTGISKLMIITNKFYELTGNGSELLIPSNILKDLILLLVPFAPKLCQTMWTALGQDGNVNEQSWPAYDPQLAVNQTIEMPVQINGKTKGSIMVSKDIEQEAFIELVKGDDKLNKYVSDGIKKVIWVPGKICNIIV